MKTTSLLSSAFAILLSSQFASATPVKTSKSVVVERASRGGSTSVESTTSLPSQRLIVTRHGISTYTKGAAHPTYSYETTNHDLETGKNLKLGELFKPGYLKAISKSAVAQLEKAMPDADGKWMREGAGPKAANFSAYEITTKGIRVNFSDYQVGPHALGPQTVVVPWSDLKGYIKPGTAISHHAE